VLSPKNYEFVVFFTSCNQERGGNSQPHLSKTIKMTDFIKTRSLNTHLFDVLYDKTGRSHKTHGLQIWASQLFQGKALV
jgi:hypothetical protein